MTGQAAPNPPDRAVRRLRLDGTDFDCQPGESVLEALLRQGASVPYSCGKGVCLTCMLRCRSGEPPAQSQHGLKDQLRLQGYFLACMCRPRHDLDLESADHDSLFTAARLAGAAPLSPQVWRILVEPSAPVDYRPGQFINLRRPDGLTRSYSLASLPSPNPEKGPSSEKGPGSRPQQLELHVKRLPGGRMSQWLCDPAQIGTSVDIQGPNGACFYAPGRPHQPLLLIGTGTGLAPLLGILREALHQGHDGEIRVYHGSRHTSGLYMNDRLRRIAGNHANLRYFPCVSGGAGNGEAAENIRPGRAEAVALCDLPDLTGWRVFLCGYAPMVHGAKKTAYLAGARLDDIHADPFELRELRARPRA